MNSFELGFTKRAHEYGLNQKLAQDLCKLAISNREEATKRDEKAKDLLPMNAAGALGDYVSLPGFGSYRAGKATALSKAIGKEPGITTTNPISSSLLGTALGGLAGGGIGHLLDQQGLTSGPESFPGNHDGSPRGTLVGALAGALAGYLTPSAMRRGDMKHNLADYRGGAEVHPVKPDKLRGIGNLLLPFSGTHRKGEAVGYNKLRGVEEDETMNTALNALHHVMPSASLLGGMTQNYSADKTIDKKK